MKLTRWKALYFYHVLSLLFFTCYCTSCREQRVDKRLQPTSTSDKVVSAPSAVDTIALLTQADLLFQLGETYLTSHKKDSGLYYHEQALDLRQRAARNDKDMFDSYVKVGDLYEAENKYDVAEKYYEKAQVIVENSGVPVDDEIRFMLDFAYIKTNLKDTPTSISLLNRLRNFINQHRPEDKLTLGNTYHALCNVYYYENQFDLALLNCKKAVNYFDEIKDYRRSGIAYGTIGMIYQKMNLPSNALTNYRKAIQRHLKWTGQESNPLSNIYLQKAVAHQELGEFDSAQYYLKWNLQIRSKVFGEKDPFTFGAKYSLAQFYESIHNYDSATKYAHECLISLVKNFNDHSILSNPIPGPTELNADLVLGLVEKGNALKLLGEQDPANDYFDFALKTYQLADSIFSIFRRNLKYDDPQLRELEVGYIPYSQMIDLAFKLFNKTGNRDYLKSAIGIMEQSRSVLLESALNEAQEYDTTEGVYVNRDKEHQLINQRIEILRQLSLTNLSKLRIDSLNESLLSVDQSFTELKRNIEQNNPHYFNLKYNQKKVELDEIQSLVKERHSILVEFLWSKEKIYALAVGPYKIETKVIHQTDSFKKAFDNFVVQVQATPEEAIKRENFNQFSQSAFMLYHELIGDLLPKNSDRNREINLIISADGPLATFPFEALITQLPKRNDVNYQLPYLIQTFPISYAYSPGILLNQSKPERDGNKLLALGFAGNGPARTQRTGLGNLPGTEKEINSIKEVMKNNGNKYFLESDASEAMFKKEIEDFDIVHLAIHGVADSSNALKSRLVFRSELDTTEDSNLYAHELYSLHMEKLDLAVLSACESGIGKQQAGEGVMSIARGFAYAGCPSLVISLWKIDDRTSAQVMSDFYKHLSYGEGLDKALANAKIDYITHAKEFNSHPAYWAAFLQVGDTRAIDVKDFDWRIAVAAILFGVLAAFAFLKLWRKMAIK